MATAMAPQQFLAETISPNQQPPPPPHQPPPPPQESLERHAQDSETTKLLLWPTNDANPSMTLSSSLSAVREGFAYNSRLNDHSSLFKNYSGTQEETRQVKNQPVNHHHHHHHHHNNNNKATTATASASAATAQTPQYNRDAVRFATRMAVCMTISSLFMLWPQGQDDNVKYPQAMWVLITVLFVTWFPNGDAASVVEKSLQRMYGTFFGAAAGLLCGFVSLKILLYSDNEPQHQGWQAIFLGTCIAVYTFVICWAAATCKVPNGKTILATYSYACILCLLTFYISIMPFYVNDDSDEAFDTSNRYDTSNIHEHPRWKSAIYRVMNVLVGCVLGAGLSMAIMPRSSVQIVHEKMQRQMQLAGQASRSVLWMAAEAFSDDVVHDDYDNNRNGNVRVSLTLSQRPWRNQASNMPHDDNEDALRKQEAAVQDSREIITQLGMLIYDPFTVGIPNDVMVSFRREVRDTLARALRIQNTVVLLDGIVRNDPNHDFSGRHIQLFADIGSLIHDMLVVPKDEAYVVLKRKLAQVRRCIIDLSTVVSQTSREIPVNEIGKIGVDIFGSQGNLASMWMDDEQENRFGVETVIEEEYEHDDMHNYHDPGELEEDDNGRGAPKYMHGSRVGALLFLQLVEHLAVRSIRLHQSWKHCEILCHAAQRKVVQSSRKKGPEARYYESRQRRP